MQEANTTGNMTGNTAGKMTGNMTGNITGNTTGNMTGNTTGFEINEKDSIENNIVLEGLFVKVSDPDQVKKALESFFETHLNLRPNITGVKRTTHNSFIIRFRTCEEKLRVLKCKQMMNRKGMEVYVKSQPPINESAIDEIIWKTAESERAKGNVVKLGQRKMFVNNTAWIWSDEEKRLVQVTGVEAGLSNTLRTFFTATETLRRQNFHRERRRGKQHHFPAHRQDV